MTSDNEKTNQTNVDRHSQAVPPHSQAENDQGEGTPPELPNAQAKPLVGPRCRAASTPAKVLVGPRCRAAIPQAKPCRGSPKQPRRSRSKISQLPEDKRAELARALDSGATYVEAIETAGVRGITPENVSAWYRSQARLKAELHSALRHAPLSPMANAQLNTIANASELEDELALGLKSARQVAFKAIEALAPQPGKPIDVASMRILATILFALPGIAAACRACASAAKQCHDEKIRFVAFEAAKRLHPVP